MGTLKFVSAGYQATPYSNTGMYIKYGNFKRFEVIEDGPYFVHMILPDREIFLGVNNLKASSNQFLNDYDEYIDLNPLSEKYNTTITENYMFNFTDSGGIEAGLARNKTRGSTIFCDSGGFQIAMGRSSIINPIELVKYYNKNCNLGMVLDIPDYNEGNPFPDEMISDLAQIQKRNTNYMLKYIEEGVELINIIHGSTFSQKINYLREVHNDRIHRLAVPSVGIPMSLQRLNLILELCRTCKELGHYHHMHLLGTFNKGVLYILAKLAHSHIEEVQGFDFTVDASTPLQNMKNLIYCKNLTVWDGFQEFNPYMSEHFKQLDFSRASYDKNFQTFNPHAYLPCNCPVCSKLKYAYVLRNLRGGIMRNSIFLSHNTHEASEYVNMLDTLASNLTDKEYLNYVSTIQDSDCSDAIICLKFIKHIEKVGLDQARIDYKNYLVEKDYSIKPFSLFEETKSRPLSDYLQNLINQYKAIDFENYNEKIKVGKGLRSATTVKKEF